MNILFIVTEIKSANGICCNAIMENLYLSGHNVFCITNAEYTTFPKNKGIEYHFVAPRLTYKLLKKSEMNVGIKGVFERLVATFINKIKLFFSIPTWPLISLAYAQRIYHKAKTICQKNCIDMIIPVYTQIDALIAANRIKAEMPNIRYIPYFLDSLSGGYGPKCLSKEWVIRRGIKWEDKLLPYADKIIMMQSSKMHYQKYAIDKEYYKEIVFLDLPLFNLNVITSQEAGLPKDKINLLYIGTIPIHIRNPKYFLDVLGRIKGEDILFYIVGTCSDMKMLSSMAQKDNRIRLMPPVEHDMSLALMREADILVNFGNNNPCMTPCKIFEYMSIGKPIISTEPIENEPSSVYLSKYPLSLMLKEYDCNLESDAKEVEEFIRQRRQLNIEELSELKKTFFLNTPEIFVSEIAV